MLGLVSNLEFGIVLLTKNGYSSPSVDKKDCRFYLSLFYFFFFFHFFVVGLLVCFSLVSLTLPTEGCRLESALNFFFSASFWN